MWLKRDFRFQIAHAWFVLTCPKQCVVTRSLKNMPNRVILSLSCFLKGRKQYLFNTKCLPNSSFCSLFLNTNYCRGNPKQRDHLHDLMRREVLIQDPEAPNLKSCPPPVKNGHGVKEIGSMVIPDSNITVSEEAASTQTMSDPPSRNEQLPPCKKLRLDNNLLQSNGKEKVASSKSKSSSSAAGMFSNLLIRQLAGVADFSL